MTPKRKPGRPNTAPELQRVKQNFTLSPEAIDVLEKAARRTGLSKSALIEQAIRLQLEADEAKRLKADSKLPMFTVKSIESSNVLAFPEIPLLHAAAGAPVSADHDTYAPMREIGPDRFAVQLHGDSMSPRYPSGSIVILRERESLTRKYLKKGEIYLFDINGEKTLKVYGSRVARKDEIADGVSYTSPADGKTKVRILKSLNPEFPEIRVTEDVSWLGWLDKDDNK